MSMNFSSYILNCWKHFLIGLFVLFCAVMLGFGCEGFGVALIVISLSCILIPGIIYVLKRPKWLIIDVVTQWLFSGFMVVGIVLLISGLIGVFQNESFLRGACSGVTFSLKLTLGLLKFASSAI